MHGFEQLCCYTDDEQKEWLEALLNAKLPVKQQVRLLNCLLIYLMHRHGSCSTVYSLAVFSFVCHAAAQLSDEAARCGCCAYDAVCFNKTDCIWSYRGGPMLVALSLRC
jgi:hypothetical protein